MANVVGVKFEKSPKIYYFEADKEYEKGAYVLVETMRGLELGTVAMPLTAMDDKDVTQPLKPVMRLATEEDMTQNEKLKAKNAEALKVSRQIIADSGLDMKVIDAEYTFDAAKLIIYFTAESRIDFRELVKQLATCFKARIELRQIGIRDECKLKGGLGPCGRACCCRSHLNEFSQVTIKMAKNQSLSLNPVKISGLCGRLMCCLAYENEHYAETNKKMPKIGSEAETLDGKKGTVTAINQIKETVTMRVFDKDMSVQAEFPLSEIKRKNPQKSANDENDSVKFEI